MASTDQVIQAIRFAFETLSERNAQHEFEHLCRHFSRARICFNILPATGPVSGGGDQGRDFETFRSFVQRLGEHHFCGVAESKKIAFACSLEKKVVAKVRSDVSKIIGCGNRPDLIYFFSSRPISVSERHKLQEWARGESVELEIFDCVALSEQLADPEIFWIAVRYLQISPEIYPALDNATTEYEELSSKWFSSGSNIQRFADFVEVKRAARIALGSAPQDLSRWLVLIADYEVQCQSPTECHQVWYELIVLSMRQRRSLRGEEALVRKFFGDIESLEFPDTATRVETVHSYVATALLLGEVKLTGEELDTWHDSIVSACEAGISRPLSDNQLCSWLELRGNIELHAQLRSGKVDLEHCTAPWLRLTELLPEAPMFPVQDFHDLILRFAEELGDPPALDEVLNRVRPFLGQRAGASALADSHFQRAQRFLDTDQISRALRELHDARLNWFGHETIGEAADCCLLLSRCYQKMGLHVAAIYYALVASFIFANAHPSLQQYVHQGLHDAAEAAYMQGHWCLFFELVGPALAVQSSMDPSGLNISESPHLEWLFRNLPPALHATHKLAPGVYEAAMKEFRAKGMESLLAEGLDIFRGAAAKWTEEDFEKVLRNTFTGPPFSDLGTHCETMWSAFGVRWLFRWPNDYQTTRVALEVVAFLQIALSELAGYDLDVIPGTLLAEIECGDAPAVTIESVPDNSVCHWALRVPREPLLRTEGVDDFRTQMLTCFVEMVRSISAMSDAEFVDLFRREIGPHIFSHDFFARRLPELFDFFAGKQRFGAVGRVVYTAPFNSNDWHPKETKDLAWVKVTHPKFDRVKALDQVSKRYEVGFAGLRYTLERGAQSPSFRTTVEVLYSEGWKDWHVLMAMLNVAANYRVSLRYDLRENPSQYSDAMWDELFSTEKPDSPPVPLDRFSRENLRIHLLMALGSGLRSDGLVLHHSTPSIDDLFEYARYRWCYFDLDVVHPNIFGAKPTG